MAILPKEQDPYKEFEESLNAMGDQEELGDLYDAMKEQSQQTTKENIAQLEKQKDASQQTYEEEVRSARANTQKEMNPYGVQRESLYDEGMGSSGYAQSVMARNYQSLQNRLASAYKTNEEAKSTLDAAIAKAKTQSDSYLAQLALEEYSAKTQNLWQMYEAKLNLKNASLDYERYLTDLMREDAQEAYERKIDRDVNHKKYR